MSKASRKPLAKASAVNSVVNVPSSMDELINLSAALTNFTCRYDELKTHMESIQESIDNLCMKRNNEESEVSVVVPASASVVVPASSSSTPVEKTVESVESIDEMMNNTTVGGRTLRKYIALHLSDVEKLREEIPAALKRAPNPGRLGLNGIGKFYLQGIKAYVKKSPMIPHRMSSLLMLEFLLLSGCTNFEDSIKKEAEVAAVAWRERVISEGGIHNAGKEDARGLLLFVASYGIPTVFVNDDLMHLVLLSNVREISKALQQSSILRARISGIINRMLKKGMRREAIEAVYSFAVEEQFPPESILSSSLKDSEEAWEKARKKSQKSPLALKEANEKHLASLKSVRESLEEYTIDPKKLAEWTISDKIADLEKENSDLNKAIEEKQTLKRKADAGISREVKPRQTSNGVPQQMHSNTMVSNEARAMNLANGQTIYGGGHFGNFNGYAAPSILGPAGTGATNVAFPGMYGYGGGISHEESAHLLRHGAGPYLLHGNESLTGYLPEHTFARPPTFHDRGYLTSVSGTEQCYAGQPGTSIGFGNRNPKSDLYQFADAVLDGGSSYARHT